MEKAKQGIQLRGRRFIRKLQWHVAKRGSDSRSAIAALFQDPSELLEGAGIGVQPRFQSFHYHSSLLSLLAKWHSLSNNGKKRTRWKRRDFLSIAKSGENERRPRFVAASSMFPIWMILTIAETTTSP